jgi:trimeric autotransporter adhesin
MLLVGCTHAAPPKSLVAIALTPAFNTTIQAGYPLQFVARLTYADGSTEVVTSGVTWASSSPEVVSISSTGLAAVVSLGGTPEITASKDGITRQPIVLFPYLTNS